MWIGRKKKDDGLLQMKHRPFYYLSLILGFLNRFTEYNALDVILLYFLEKTVPVDAVAIFVLPMKREAVNVISARLQAF